MPEDLSDELQDVIGLIHAKRLDEARRALEEIVEREPQNAKAYTLLAGTLTDLREYPEAIEAAQKAAELAPESAGAHNQLGIALTRVGRPADARHAFANALVLNPRNGRTRAYYLAATRLTLPVFNVFFGRTRRANSARAAALVGSAILLLIFFQNPIEAGAMLFVLIFLSLIGLHLGGTIVIHQDRRVRKVLRPEEFVPAYWFFGNFAAAAILGPAAAVLRDASLGWISATCVVCAFATAMYAIPASLPNAARGFYRVAGIFAWLGLLITVAGQALAVEMAIKLPNAAHAMAWINAMLTLLFSIAIASVFSLLLFLLFARLFNALPRRSAPATN